MRERGISNPNDLLALADPATVLVTCAAWDARPAAGPGVLALMIREAQPATLADPAPPCSPPPELWKQWRDVLDRLEASVSRDEWVMRYAPWALLLHPHSFSDVTGWELGAEGWVLGWLGDRVAGLRRAAGRPVAVVTCEAWR